MDKFCLAKIWPSDLSLPMPDVDLTRTTDLLQLHQVDGQEFGKKVCVQVGAAPQEVTPGPEKDNVSEIQHLIDEATFVRLNEMFFNRRSADQMSLDCWSNDF